MTKFQLNFGIALLVGLALTLHSSVNADQAVPPVPKIYVKQPNDIKIFVQDNSRVLSKEEADKLPNKDSIPVLTPVEKVDKTVKDVNSNAVDNGENLPPIPVVPFNLFDSLNTVQKAVQDQSGAAASSSDDQQQPKGIISVLLLKASHKLGDDQSPPSDTGLGFRSFVILKYLPKSVGNLLGLDGSDPTEDENSELDGPKLLGGDDDVDSKRESMHLLGGGGENDPDRLRFRIDEDKGVFTGNDDALINSNAANNNIEQHRFIMFSMFDRIRNLFNNFDQSNDQQQSVDDDSSPPFIIRTDDGSAAIIPNDIGYAEKQQQSLNKCMMLNFMRLKASMYYRTILHLLFFTGVLLFILSLIMLTIRSYKRRRYVRHPMSIATIDGSQTGKDAAAAAAKFNSYRAWSGDIEQSIIGSDSKIVLIQAPPAYDQVIINDKTSSLTSSNSKLFASVACNNNRRTNEDASDDCETKSLPPDYEGTFVNKANSN